MPFLWLPPRSPDARLVVAAGVVSQHWRVPHVLSCGPLAQHFMRVLAFPGPRPKLCPHTGAFSMQP